MQEFVKGTSVRQGQVVRPLPILWHWVSLNNTLSKYIVEVKVKVKVKCILVQTLRLCTGRMAHRGSRGIALLFLDHGTRRFSVTPRPLFTPRKDPVPIVQDVGWAPGPVCTGAENLSPTGFQSPDRRDRSQSLYRLRYPAHTKYIDH